MPSLREHLTGSESRAKEKPAPSSTGARQTDIRLPPCCSLPRAERTAIQQTSYMRLIDRLSHLGCYRASIASKVWTRVRREGPGSAAGQSLRGILLAGRWKSRGPFSPRPPCSPLPPPPLLLRSCRAEQLSRDEVEGRGYRDPVAGSTRWVAGSRRNSSRPDRTIKSKDFLSSIAVWLWVLHHSPRPLGRVDPERLLLYVPGKTVERPFLCLARLLSHRTYIPCRSMATAFERRTTQSHKPCS